MTARLLLAAAFLCSGCGTSESEGRGSEIQVLHLRGTPEEMGRQAGSAMRKEIRALVEGYLPQLLGVGEERAERLRQARLLEPGIPERYREELAALSREAGVSYDDLLMANCSVELVDAMLCSAAVVPPEASLEGEALFGRNLDWLGAEALASFGRVVVVHPEGRTPFVSVGYPGLVGVVTGVNARGVGVANLVVSRGRPDCDVGMPYFFLLREMMETCGDRGGCERLLQDASRTVPQNVIVADRSGGDVFECTAKSFRKRMEPTSCRAVTNGFGEGTNGSGSRYRTLNSLWASGRTDASSLLVGLRRAAIAPMNVQCCLFRLGSMRASISIGEVPASEGRFHEVDLGAWFSSRGEER